MKIDVGLRSHDLHALGGEAAAYERLGVDGLWSYETAMIPSCRCSPRRSRPSAWAWAPGSRSPSGAPRSPWRRPPGTYSA